MFYLCLLCSLLPSMLSPFIIFLVADSHTLYISTLIRIRQYIWLRIELSTIMLRVYTLWLCLYLLCGSFDGAVEICQNQRVMCLTWNCGKCSLSEAKISFHYSWANIFSVHWPLRWHQVPCLRELSSWKTVTLWNGRLINKINCFFLLS